MPFLVVGTSHKFAPLSLREKLALNAGRQADAYLQLKGQKYLQEAVLLFTCNRAEAYALVEDLDEGQQRLKEFFAGLYPSEAGNIKKSLYALAGDEGYHHLLKVASSLDSMVLGEAQILGQVKEAYETGVRHQSVGAFLHGLFHRVFRAAKDVRTHTELGKFSSSVPSVAVDLAARIFSDLSNRRVLLLGAGEIGRLSAEHLQSAGVKSISVISRSGAKAQELARLFRGQALDNAQLGDALVETDVLLASTTAEEYLITRPLMEQTMPKRHYRPLLLIDLAVPRNIDPALEKMDHVYLYHLDHLQQVAEEHRGKRLEASREAMHLLGKHLDEIREWQASSRLAPTIEALTKKIETLRQAEVDKARQKLGHLAPADFEKVDYLSKALTNKILNTPLKKLRQALKKDSLLVKELAVLEELFELEGEKP